MEREMEYLLTLLKGFLWGQSAGAEPEVDWTRLQELAAIHGVGGILGYMSMTAPIAPESLRPRLRQDCIQTMNLYNRRAVLAQGLVSALAEKGVDCCRVKGLVVRQLYPVPELRSFNDVDLLIRREDRERVHQYMLQAGYRCDVDYGHVYCYQRGSEYYEIHTQLISRDIKDQADYCGFFDRAWEHMEQTAPHCCRLEKEFHLLYLLCHIAKHAAGSGAGVRMYLDIAACIKAYDDCLDWAQIFAWLQELNLTQFGCAVLTAVESWFGVESRGQFPRLNEQTLERFAQFTLEAGVFGHHGRDNALTVLKTSQGSRGKMLLGRLFPSAGYLEKRYSYLQGRHWLVPVAWAQRALESKGGTPRQFAREAKNILTHDDQEVERLKDICKEIGL